MREFFAAVLVLLVSDLLFGYSNFVSLDEVTNGQRGYGLTVWSGNQLKKFDFEVVGVLKSNPKSGVIIAKSDDEELKRVGVVAGMSGSPVYIGNKLLGALAFTWTYLKEPMFGITPISDMLDLEKYQRRYVSLPKDLRYVVPLLVSGVSREVRPILNNCFSNYNVELIDSFSYFKVLSDGSRRSKKDEVVFKPGDAIGINLVTGDMELTAIGTVTHVEGNKVFALGHPAFLAGDVEIPVSTVDVFDVVPRQSLSFKLGVPSELVGTMRFDGSSGVYAEVGIIPEMIGVSVNVDNEYLYRYNIAKVKDLLPQLIEAVFTESVVRSKGIFGEGNVWITTTVGFSVSSGFLKDDFSLTFNDILPVYNLQVGYYYALSDVISLLSFLNYNPSFKVDINKVHIDVSTKELDAGFIVFVVPSKSKVNRGEEVSVKVGIRKFRGDIETKEFTFRVPTWVQSGTKINLGATSKLSRTLQLLSTYSEYLALDTYDKLYNFISESLRVDKLVVYMEVASPNVASGGNVFSLLPLYLMPTLLGEMKSKNLLPYIMEEEETESYPFVGFATSQILVK
jgi:hypothetical protein